MGSDDLMNTIRPRLDLSAFSRPTTSLLAAGEAMDFGRTKTYELVRLGQFPIRVERVGGRYFVRTVELLRYLGLTAETTATAA